MNTQRFLQTITALCVAFGLAKCGVFAVDTTMLAPQIVGGLDDCTHSDQQNNLPCGTVDDWPSPCEKSYDKAESIPGQTNDFIAIDRLQCTHDGCVNVTFPVRGNQADHPCHQVPVPESIDVFGP